MTERERSPATLLTGGPTLPEGIGGVSKFERSLEQRQQLPLRYRWTRAHGVCGKAIRLRHGRKNREKEFERREQQMNSLVIMIIHSDVEFICRFVFSRVTLLKTKAF